jgi:glycosyltransferase involved in cell wall biosynthesis
MSRLKVNLIGRIDGKTGIAQHTKSFMNSLKTEYDLNFLDSRPESSDHSFIPTGIKTFQQHHEFLETADVSIFLDVTSDNHSDINWQKVPATKIKYIYSVFDSTKIPISWADIINNHFDAVFVPSRFLVDVYRNSNVQKPIFHLPLALDLSPYRDLPTPYAPNKPFVFAFVGSREPRKNIDLLMDSFVECFGNRFDVQLRIHCALDFYNDPTFGENVVKRHSNIIFSSGTLENDDYRNLVRESDCFVSLSRGEGYSIVPREFLAAGKPVILSDCFAHAEILSDLNALGKNLGFAVDASIPVPGHYLHINGGGIFGLQYDSYRPSIRAVLNEVFEKRGTLFRTDLVELRRKCAEGYDQNTLAPIYKSIIQPAFCRMSTGNALEFGGITTNDANLAHRITGKNFSLSGWQEISPSPRKIVVIGNDGGFFSVFNRFVSYLTWTLSENPKSVVLPDWRTDSMQRHWKTNKFTSFCYGKPADGNIWLKLFKPLPFHEFSEKDYDDDSKLYVDATLKDDYNEENEPWLTYIHPYKLYHSPGFQRWRHWYHLYLSAYIQLQDHIKNKIDSIYEANLKGYKVISAHIRHPSHGMEQPGGKIPTVDLYCSIIREIQGKECLDNNNSRIFLATDQESVVERVKEEFGDMVIYAADAARTSQDNDNEFNQQSFENKMQEGFQIQHLTAANPENWSTRMAEEVIVDTYLLAKGDFFIHVTSNIATAVSYINPLIKMVYCE